MKRSPDSPKLSRRDFLGRAVTTVGAALAFPTIVPGSALGLNGAVLPSERITMGFIGVGGQGGGHLFGGQWTYVAGGFAGREDVQVLAVCDVRRSRRDTATARVNAHYAERFGREKYRACAAYNDFREVLARPDIDAVLIGTPAHWHATMTVMAANAGKDIYCEKPSAGTLQESRAVFAAVRRHGRVYQAGTQQRSEYGGKFRLACELIRSGRIGRLRAVYCPRGGGMLGWPARTGVPRPVPAELDWDLYLGPAPMFPYDGVATAHRFDVGELNWGQHHYDIIQWALDADETGPVEAFIDADGLPGLRYANGVLVYSQGYPGESVGYQGGACFVGTAGRISVDRDNLVSEPAGIVKEPIHPGEVHLPRNNGHADNFLKCVRTRERTICDAGVAHHSANAVLLGGVVRQIQRTVKWDPVGERFDDDEANRFLSIAKRAPWRT